MDYNRLLFKFHGNKNKVKVKYCSKEGHLLQLLSFN